MPAWSVLIKKYVISNFHPIGINPFKQLSKSINSPSKDFFSKRSSGKLTTYELIWVLILFNMILFLLAGCFLYTLFFFLYSAATHDLDFLRFELVLPQLVRLYQ